ncbi:MAG: condensation domain-containing protein [Pyrinomonadaceae bacterium]
MGKFSDDIAGLTPERRALLELRLKNRRAGARPSGMGGARREGGSFPLSYAQRRLWFLDQFEPGSAAYNIPDAVRLRGRLDVAALEQGLGEITRRHEILRTVFTPEAGEPRQLVRPHALFALALVDLAALGVAGPQSRAVWRLARDEARRPFDLSSGPLLRATLLRLGSREHVLLLTVHHIVSDAWSMGVFTRELAALYDAYAAGRPSPLAELTVQYVDFARWQKERLSGEALEGLINYWRRQLEGPLPVLRLPTDRPRPAVQTFRGMRRPFVVPPELCEALKRLGRGEGCTLFMTLLAAFATLLHRYTGQGDLVVGTNIANRNRAEIEGLVGFFVNMLALRTDCSDNPTFRRLLRRVRDTTLDAYAHQDLPFDHLVEVLRPDRTLTHTPIFQVVFSLQNAPSETVRRPSLELEVLTVEQGTSKYDLVVNMWEAGRDLKGSLEFNLDLFDEETAARIVGHFVLLLQSVVARPDARLDELEMLSDEERAVLAGATQVDELGENFRL